MINESSNLTTHLPVVLTTMDINNVSSSMNVSSTDLILTTKGTNNVSFTNVSTSGLWKYTTEVNDVSSSTNVSFTDVWSNTTVQAVVLDIRAFYFLIIGASLLVACVVGFIVFISYRSGLCDRREERKNMKRKQRRLQTQVTENHELHGIPVRDGACVNFTENTTMSGHDASTAPYELEVKSNGTTNQGKDIMRQESVPSSGGSDYNEQVNSDNEDNDSVFYSYENQNCMDGESFDVHF
ncbi:uncharacterized protein LOC135483401 [Lineus longissimus]|uniref:uncharacterized protein LOC135483401 n=1 Tax=Lineus longissimus TaxID=88925 RepID=UPI002B4D64A0